MCGGTGIVESSANIIIGIEKWIVKYKAEHKGKHSGKLILEVHPMVFKQLREGTISQITKLSFKHLIRLTLVEENSLSLQDFKFILAKSKEDITQYYKGT
jgi:hypothetical protein